MQIAVIGVGVMGSAIAGRLLETGAGLTLYDRDSTRCDELVAKGARLAANAAEATGAADFVITSLNSADIVESAVFGPDGIAEAATSDKILFDMSSIDAGRSAQLAARLLDETGMEWVDAPLSGGAPAAAKGTLTLMIGGHDEAVARARPLIEALSSNATHLGGPGAGQTVKLINQLLCANTFLAVAEGVRFAEAQGVDASKIPAALAGGRADSRILQEFMGKMAARDFSPTGRIDNMLKDLETVQAAAMSKRLAMPLTTLAADLHRMLVSGGLGAADSAEYVRLFDMAREEPAA
ncbi:NAD(P)-dependent oxidoreductase [Novosphingobium sp. MBES04]|uniref:NAD(P)-dependent oxidoreductase n=1 Tax=Novosphingobium sp. MBES04 TaxID=1206458 RepID=UPI00057E41A9|nr:NAD(P)-dependent oxidoreductase [Novosphingobium sp. MBES04]GAM05102.1 2-hydroxy-3-oxopropionate reductase [Novosphingobium sp. MBES04]